MSHTAAGPAPGPAPAVPRVLVRLSGMEEVRVKCDPGDEIADLRSVLPKEINTFSELYRIMDLASWDAFKTNPDAQGAFLKSTPTPKPLGAREPVVDGMRLLAVPPGGGGAGVAAPGVRAQPSQNVAALPNLFAGQLADHGLHLQLTKGRIKKLTTDPRFKAVRDALWRGDTLDVDTTRDAVRRLQAQWLSTTVGRFNTANQIVLNGPIPGAEGQVANELQFAFRGSQIFCAKLGPASKLQREFDAWKAVSAQWTTPALLPMHEALKARSAENEERLALIMPLCSLSVASAAGSFKPDAADRAVLLANSAICAGAGIAAFSLAGWRHGDVKPQNLLFLPSADYAGSCGIIALGDFGAAVPDVPTSFVAEATHGYGLDISYDVPCSYDLACLATTVLVLLDEGSDLADTPSVAALQALCRDRAEHSSAHAKPLWGFIVNCSEMASSGERRDVEAAMNELRHHLQTMHDGVLAALVSEELDRLAGALISLDQVWPKPAATGGGAGLAKALGTH